MDAEYKHLMMGMIFIKYLSDNFVSQQERVLKMVSNPKSEYYLGNVPRDIKEAIEDRDYYIMNNCFWIPSNCRWEFLEEVSNNEFLGKFLDEAIISITQENKVLMGKFNTRFEFSHFEKTKLQEIFKIVRNIKFEIDQNFNCTSTSLIKIYERILLEF